MEATIFVNIIIVITMSNNKIYLCNRTGNKSM